MKIKESKKTIAATVFIVAVTFFCLYAYNVFNIGKTSEFTMFLGETTLVGNFLEPSKGGFLFETTIDNETVSVLVSSDEGWESLENIAISDGPFAITGSLSYINCSYTYEQCFNGYIISADKIEKAV